MQKAELYVIMLYIAEGSTPQRICYTGEGSGISILRETPNCWYLSCPPHGLPVRYRKTEEYKLLSNKFGIYMFGRDSTELTVVWNTSTSAQITRNFDAVTDG